MDYMAQQADRQIEGAIFEFERLSKELEDAKMKIKELEAYRLNAAKFMADVIAEKDAHREALRRIASENHTRIYMQDIAREALNA